MRTPRVPQVGAIALALLVCGCVFMALAGPAVSLRERTQALHQVLGPVGSLGAAVEMEANWTSYTSAYYSGNPQGLTQDDFRSSTIFIGEGLAATPLPIAAGSWGALTTEQYRVISGTDAGSPGVTPQLEVTYRDPLTSNVQLVSGQLTVPRGAIGVAVTSQTAARFGLHPGSRLKLEGLSGPVQLAVTAIVRERDAGSAFWTADPLVAAPALTQLPHNAGAAWQGAVFADPGQLTAMQSAFCQMTLESCGGLQLLWEFPVAVNTVNADQAQALLNHLAQVSGNDTAINDDDLGEASTTLMANSPLTAELTGFLTAQATVLTVPLLVFVSLILLGLAVIMLAARMIVTGRQDELPTRRARGASVRQVTTLVLSGAALAAVPGAAVGAGLAIAIFPEALTAPGGSASLSRAPGCGA
jgi:hypothetical protein